MNDAVETESKKQKPSGPLSTLSLSKIDTSTPAGEQIYSILRAAIVEMHLPPGCSISEAEVAAKLGASRTPVREALLRLREEGLINTLPSRGNFVSTLSRQRILESQFLREAIELANVQKITEVGLSEEYLLLLERNLTGQQEAAECADYPRFRELDDQFHGLLAQATGLKRVAEVLGREKIQLDRLRSLSLKVDGQQETLLKAHTAIFEAVKTGDADQALVLTRAHCRTILGVLEDLSNQHQEYFS